MDFSERLVKDYQDEASLRLAAVCRYIIVLIILMLGLSKIQLFDLPQGTDLVLGISAAILFLPTVFYTFCHMDSTLIRYFVLTMLVLMSGTIYVILAHHVMIMLVLPVVISCLYRSRKCVWFTTLMSIPVIIAAHMLSFQINLFPDPSITNLWALFAKAIFPRLIEFIGIVLVGLVITDSFNDLVKKLIKTNDQMYKDQESLISSLATMVEMQSQETGQHVRRVSEYTRILCEALGMDSTETWKVSMAAMMHDVGKIAIPRDILEKPGRLTDEEFIVVKRHIFYGKEILEQYPGEIMQLSAVIAYQHHEHFDGTGYMGLAGNEISRVAQCVALADFFDALVSKRAYKDAWTPEQARREILAQKNKYFDPYLVNLFDIHFVDFLEVYRMYPD